MNKTSLTRALFVAGVLAFAGSMAQADAIFYPDGTHVELGANGVENGMANTVLARSPSTAPDMQTLTAMGLSDQSAPMLALNDDFDSSPGTTVLGAGPAVTRTETVVTTTPVYVFPNINFDRTTVLSQPHPMMSQSRSLDMDRTAAATFNSPTQAGEASTMTAGAPNQQTTNTPGSESFALSPPVLLPNTTVLGAGPSVIVPETTLIVPNTTTLGAGPSNLIDPNTGQQGKVGSPMNCASTHTNCQYLPD
jgi:hypothetical protein